MVNALIVLDDSSSPDVIAQLLAGHDPARMLDQIREDAGGLVGQREQVAVSAKLARLGVESEPVEADRTVIGWRPAGIRHFVRNGEGRATTLVLAK